MLKEADYFCVSGVEGQKQDVDRESLCTSGQDCFEDDHSTSYHIHQFCDELVHDEK